MKRYRRLRAAYVNNSSNELTSIPGTTYTYDNNGNMQTKVVGSNTTSYAWDFENRLTSVTLPGSGGTVSFAYDPFGRRIKKVSSAGTSIFAYDGDNAVEETNASGTAVARYSQGLNIDEPLAMLRGGSTSFYHADGLSSITSLSNSSGAIAQTYAFDSFGNQTGSSGSLTNPFQYTARESDAETGLYYYRARYYDPNAGRFLSEDPLGSGGGLNFYGYAGNSSPNLKDIFGLDYSTSRSGNTIIVNASITLYGPGANETLAAKWQRDILNVWNNNIGYGKCDVIFNVKVIADPDAKDSKHASSPAGFPGANNFISVPDGSPSELGNPHINFDWGSPHTGTIPSGTLGPSVAHEFGHLLHLYDSNLWGWHWNLLRPKSDIMNEVDAVGRYDIDRIVGGGKASTCGCQ